MTNPLKKLICAVVVLIMILSVNGCSKSDTTVRLDTSETNSETYVSGSSSTKFNAENYYKILQNCVDQIKAKTDFIPDVALILDSENSSYTDSLEIKETIAYKDIVGFPKYSEEGTGGNLIFAEYKGIKVAVMQGRFHYYEGCDIHDVVLPLRVIHMLGANTALITSYAHAVNYNYSIGDFISVKDHISSFIPSPLNGENIDELGERFPDSGNIYDSQLREAVFEAAQETGVNVQEGILLQISGPQYETPAETETYRLSGADLIGMSAVDEAVAAAHMGMKVCSISCINDMAAENSDSEYIQPDTGEFSENFSELISVILEKISSLDFEDNSETASETLIQ